MYYFGELQHLFLENYFLRNHFKYYTPLLMNFSRITELIHNLMYK